MKQKFSYQKFNNEALDNIVETFALLTDKYLDGKSNTKEYQEANKALNEAFMTECAKEVAAFNYTGIEDVKEPMLYNSPYFIAKFDTILARVLTPVIPAVISRNYDQLYDLTQTGWGDSAKFEVESNELFLVSDIAEGVARGGVQTLLNTEYTISASPRQIATYVDWYLVAAGKLDWGKICAKVGLSYANFIQGMVIKSMSSTIAQAGNYGIGGYMANGFSDANWVTVARNVSLANGGAQVYALGTEVALMDVLPAESAISGFRYGENSEIVKTGHLPAYKKVPLIVLDQSIVPNTVNGPNPPTTNVSDDIIFMLPMGLNKPVHVVIEGNALTVQKNPYEMKDHSYTFTVTAHLGVGVVIGSKIGAITLR